MGKGKQPWSKETTTLSQVRLTIKGAEYLRRLDRGR